MTDLEQIEHMEGDLDKLIDRYRSEYDMNFASVIGCLHLKIYELSAESCEDGES